MAPKAKARISNFFSSDPLDPNFDSWSDEDLDDDNTTTARPAVASYDPTDATSIHPTSPGFDPTYPFSPAFARPTLREEPNDNRFSYTTSIVHSPTQLSPPSTSQDNVQPAPHDEIPDHFRIGSPPRPRRQNTLPSARPAPPREPNRRKSTLDSVVLPPVLIAGGAHQNSMRQDSEYTIPDAPPPPTVPLNIDFIDRDPYPRGNDEWMKRNTSRLSRGETLSRWGRNIMGSIRRNRSSYMGSRRNRGSRHVHADEEGALVDEDQIEEHINFDVSSYGHDFNVPNKAANAMRQKLMDDSYAYTGTGEAVDLSNLSGFNDDKKRANTDFDAIRRAGTMENTDKQSYYFPPDRHVPNWKPMPMQTWFIALLITITIGMVISIEWMYQLSSQKKIRSPTQPNCNTTLQGVDPEVALEGLFGYCSIDDLSTLDFSIWKYIPTIVGVVYGILWKVTDTEIKRAEPYYQLSRGSKGALAAESLNIEYHTFWSLLVPVEATKYRQWTVVASSIASLLAFMIIPTFFSVFIRVNPAQSQRQNWLNQYPDKYKHDRDIMKNIIVDGRFARLSEVFLIIVALLGTYILVKLLTRRSGLIGDPSGIAGVAAMANKSHILMDFKDLDLATEEKIHKQLNKRTYILHKGALWQAQLLKESERDDTAPKPMNPHPLFMRPKGMLPFMVFCLLLLAATPMLVNIRSLNVIVDKTPWVMVYLSVVVKSVWEIVEKDMRMLEPFWLLFKRHCEPSVLTLDYSATIPGFIVIKALSKGHILLAWVNFVTLLIEVLTVVMGSLDGSGGEESTLSSNLSFVFAVWILVILLGTQALVLKLRRHPFLPRQPGTISSVLCFIHQSRMLTDFEGTEQQTTMQRKKKLGKTGKTFGFGWYPGRDGKVHLGIDQEPLLQGYAFASDYREMILQNPTSWQHF